MFVSKNICTHLTHVCLCVFAACQRARSRVFFCSNDAKKIKQNVDVYFVVVLCVSACIVGWPPGKNAPFV